MQGPKACIYPMNAHKRTEIFTRFKAANPHPATELVYGSPFELLIAVILSAQATDKSVNLATKKLFPKANTPQKILELGENGLQEYIKSIGLYKTKAKNILATCTLLIQNHGGEVASHPGGIGTAYRGGPEDRKRNAEYGVWPTGHGCKHSHIPGLQPHRNSSGKDCLEVKRKLLKCVPGQFRHDAHHWLILHGRYICVARKPKCPVCLINNLSKYVEKSPVL